MIVNMPYIGRVLSVNYYKVRGRGGVKTNKTKPETTAWMQELSSKVREGFQLNGWSPSCLIVKVLGLFQDYRCPDMDNLSKVILDAVSEGSGVNDKYIKFVSEGFLVGSLDPSLRVTIEEDTP